MTRESVFHVHGVSKVYRLGEVDVRAPDRVDVYAWECDVGSRVKASAR